MLELFYLDLPVAMVENHGDGWITCDSLTEIDKKGRPRRAKYFCNQLRWSPFGKRVLQPLRLWDHGLYDEDLT